MLVDVPLPRDFTPRMNRVFRCAAALLVLSSTGCIFGHKHKETPPSPVVDLTTGASVTPASTNTFLVTPDLSVSGHVVRVNQNLRFVVLTFPIGQTPPNGTRMNVYRRGDIVGEVRVTDQQ